MIATIVNLSYLIGAVAFVWGLRLMSSPDTARKGNLLASFGMGMAILATLIVPLPNASNNYFWIVGGDIRYIADNFINCIRSLLS